MLIWPAKDPDEVIDYAVDWFDRLAGDTISSAAFSIVTGTISIVSSEYDERFSVLRLSGGAAGERAKVLCEIVTTDGQTMQETAVLAVRAR